MIDIFKNWVSAMLCLGIFVTFIQLIIPKTNLKKYIYSLIGIITVINLVAPAVNLLKNDKVEEGVSQVIANISDTNGDEVIYEDEYSQNSEKTDEMVRKQFAENFKDDITKKLEQKGIVANTIDIFLTEQYNVEKIKINIQKIDNKKSSLSDVNDVVRYMNEVYDIEYEKIEIIEEGDVV